MKTSETAFERTAEGPGQGHVGGNTKGCKSHWPRLMGGKVGGPSYYRITEWIRMIDPSAEYWWAAAPSRCQFNFLIEKVISACSKLAVLVGGFFISSEFWMRRYVGGSCFRALIDRGDVTFMRGDDVNVKGWLIYLYFLQWYIFARREILMRCDVFKIRNTYLELNIIYFDWMILFFFQE